MADQQNRPRQAAVYGYDNRFAAEFQPVETDPIPRPAYEDDGAVISVNFQTYRAPPEEPAQVTGEKTREKTGEKTRLKILRRMAENPQITTSELAEEIGVTRKGIDWQINRLKQAGLIQRMGPARGGHWQMLHGKSPPEQGDQALK